MVSLFSPGTVVTDFGVNAASSVVAEDDPEAQSAEEAAAVLVDECIVRRRRDVYSRDDAYAAWVREYTEALRK